MGMMGVFKWLRKDIGYRDRNGRSLSMKQSCLNESYRSALQAFIDRRRFSDSTTLMPAAQDTSGAKTFLYNKNNTDDVDYDEDEILGCKSIIREVPYVPASEIFEIGCIAGTEDRYLELIFAEWENTKVSLKRNTHPNCRNAVKADIEVLVKIRHPNVLLLMAMTQTEDHGLISIFESVECTLYNYMHEQGERISIHGIAKYAGKLADALRHAHTRGYIHSAISSHCVYLVSGNTVKLGGWELATHVNKPKVERNYEERLRNEVFRWQAPELFHDYKAYKESDVYGLALLIWEMCTMQIPWSGYSYSQLKQHYTESKNRLAIELHHLPSFISSLLEAGLQLEVARRTLDINRMQRLLQNLEIQYECRDPIYATQFIDHNHEPARTFILPSTDSLNRTWHCHEEEIQRHCLNKQSFHRAKNRTSLTSVRSEIIASTRRLSGANTSSIDRTNLFDDQKENEMNYIEKLEKCTNISSEAKKKCDTTQPTNQRSRHSIGLPIVNNNTKKPLQPWNYVYKKVNMPTKLADFESNKVSVTSPQSVDITENNSVSESARINIKRLKEQLSNRRERFFYGNDTSQTTESDTSPNVQNKALTELKSKDYEPHKPASHKTSLEPKYNKSADQFNLTFTSSGQRHKLPYAHTPADIKSAIIQPRILNADPQSFFESSLWRKEKQICISKMRKDNKDETVTTEHIEDTPVKLETPECDKTYVVNRTANTATKNTPSECSSEPREDSSQNNSLRILKDTLDRATEIVRSTSSNSTVTTPSSPPSGSFDITADSSQDCKSAFGDIYDIKFSDESDEVKSIEKTDNANYTFSLQEKKNSGSNLLLATTKDVNEPEKDEQTICSTSQTHDNPDTFLFNIRQSTKSLSDTIAELSFSATAKDVAEKIENSHFKLFDSTENDVELKDGKLKSHLNVSSSSVNQNEKEILEALLTQDKNCNSCYHQYVLARRRSLPAALCHSRSANNSMLGKLPIRKAENTINSSVEDFYIDDDDLEMMNLNTDMLLLEGEMLFEELTFDK